MPPGFGVRSFCRSEPGFTVGEFVFAGVLVEELFEGGGDLSGVVSGEAVGARDEDHAVVAGSAGDDGFVVEPEVAEVVGDDGAVLSDGEGEDFGVG